MYRPFHRLGSVAGPMWLRYRPLSRAKTAGRHLVVFVRQSVSAHQSLVVLTGFILVSNAITVRAAETSNRLSSQISPIDPFTTAETVRLISPYMADIDQDPDAIAVALEERVTGSFISTNPLIATLPGQTEEPAAPKPTPAAGPAATRPAESKYTVAIGDTLSGIGSRFGLKIDTLRVKNNLSDIDAITPGQELVIPKADLPTAAISAAKTRHNLVSRAAQIANGPKRGNFDFVRPINFEYISRRLSGGHMGLDMIAAVGTPVYAAADGVVVSAEGGWNGGFGTNVLVSHGGGVTTRYAHLSRFIVGDGQGIKQGQLIAYSGNTGRSTGPHLHFETRLNGAAVDPGI